MIAPPCSGPAAGEAVFWRSRTEELAAENARLTAEIATLAGTVAAQRDQITALKERVVTLSRMLFGTSSEKSGPGQPERDAGGDRPAGEDDSAGSGRGLGRRRRGQRPGSAGHGRRRHEHLETEEHVHDLPEGERRCPRCGRAYEPLGEDVSEQVSWRVRVWRVVHRRRKYARSCRCPVPAVLTAPGPPKLTGKGLFTTEFCVNLLIAKYALGLPFNRVIAMLSFQGLQRSLKVIEDHYGVSEGQLPEGRGPLILSSDFFSVYQSFSGLEGVTPLWCWAHIRRRFIRAGDAHRKDLGEWADAWVARISALYAAHRRLASAPEGSPQAARADAAFGAALDEIDAHRRIQGRRPDLLHPAAAKVLATLDREWDGLAAHREFPSLPLDNNTAERAIRTPVVGRKNYSGSGARWSADLAGHAWTILGTAKMAGLNPRAYLDAYLDACAANNGKPPAGLALEALLPWNISLPEDPGRPP